MNGLSGFKWAISMMTIGLLFASHAFADTAAQAGQASQAEKAKIYQAWAKTPKTQDFVEARHDTLLDVTSDYQGTFHYQNPQHFSLQYHQPIQGRLSMIGDSVKVDFPDKHWQMPLAQVPDIQAFLNPLQALLSGRPQALGDLYDVRYQALPQNGWQLTYQPKANVILTTHDIIVSGVWHHQKAQVQTIQLNFANGDWRRYRMEP